MVKVCHAAGECAGMPAILCSEVDARVTCVHEEESISFSPFFNERRTCEDLCLPQDALGGGSKFRTDFAPLHHNIGEDRPAHLASDALEVPLLEEFSGDSM